MFIQSEHTELVNTAELWEAAQQALVDRDLEVTVEAEQRAGWNLVATVRARGHVQRYVVDVRRTVSNATLASLAKPPAKHRSLLVAPYVTGAIAARCRALGIDYVDAAGNMLLDLPWMVVDVQGRRRAGKPTARLRGARMFQPSGLKVVFALLCGDELSTAPLREIAAQSATSLGSVQLVMTELDADGYLDGRRLIHTRRLFDRWVEAYDMVLRPRLSLGSFDTDDPAPWLSAKIDVEGHDAQWGGESAAYVLAGHLRPGHAVVYADDIPRSLLRKYRLHRAAGVGVVEVRRRFWAFTDDAPLPSCVPTPLVYADLVASAEPRQVEAARSLRESDRVLRSIDAR
jgi:hypothetical protein